MYKHKNPFSRCKCSHLNLLQESLFLTEHVFSCRTGSARDNSLRRALANTLKRTSAKQLWFLGWF